MDFAPLIIDRNYNFHSHTQFCDGHAPMEEMAEAAVKAGMMHYGFTPHSPIPCVSPCNMSSQDVPEYIQRAARIREKYQDTCTFYTGMEVDYLGSEWGPAHPYFSNLGLDYTIGSVHFIPDFYGEPVDIDGSPERFCNNLKDRFRGDLDYVVDTFFSNSVQMIETGGFDILGHADKIGLNASYVSESVEGGSLYRSWMDRLLDAIVRHRPVVELNTKAYTAHGRFYPAASLLKKLIENNIIITVNSDAHYPDKISASRTEAFALIDSLS